MAKKRRGVPAAGRHPLNAAPVPGDHGTPETRRRLSVDPLSAMRLESDLERAGLEMRDAASRLAVPSVTRLGAEGIGAAGDARPGLERMERRTQAVMAYTAWEADARLRLGRWALEATWLVVVEGHPCSHVDRAYSLRNGSAAGAVRSALELYAEMRGWRRPVNKIGANTSDRAPMRAAA